MSEQMNVSMSQLSINPASSPNEPEDWDRSMDLSEQGACTPQNSVVFPASSEEGGAGTSGSARGGKPKRTLSELLRLHAENKEVTLSPEEASRIADVLGQWINSGSSPYESEDDFFTRSLGDSALTSKRSASASLNPSGRQRGRSESVVTAGTNT